MSARDMVAYKIVNKLKQSGWRIPEDVSVVGFDDDIYATLTIPNLTTVRVNVAEMTSLAVNMIINKIRSNKSYGRIPVRGEDHYQGFGKDNKPEPGGYGMSRHSAIPEIRFLTPEEPPF